MGEKRCGTAESIILSDLTKSVGIINIHSAAARLKKLWEDSSTLKKEKQLTVQQNGSTIIRQAD